MSHLLYLMFRCDFDVMENLENLEESEGSDHSRHAARVPAGLEGREQEDFARASREEEL